MCVNMINDTVYAVWGDTRNGFLNIWFQQLDLAARTISIKDLANDIRTISVYPNPASDNLIINLGDNKLTAASVEIINAIGDVVFRKETLTQIEKLDISSFSKGSYFLKFTNKNGSKTIKIVKK